jgi:hypothetical protein
VVDDGLSADLDAAERWVEGWQSGIEARAAQARAMSHRLAELTGKAYSGDRSVEVTVDSSGAMTDLQLDERIRKWPAARTGREILAVMRAAQAQVRREATKVVAETVGLDSPTGRAVADAFARLPDAPQGGWDAAS